MKRYNYNAMKKFLQVAFYFFGKPYIFGGKGSRGIDCSGLVVECLKTIGAMSLKGDLTAQGLYARFKEYEVDKPVTGALAFWYNGQRRKMTHVAICIDEEYCITADGGGRKTKTVMDAMTAQARVKIRRIDHRMKYPKFINLFQ